MASSDEARSDELECIFKKFGLTCPNHPCPIKQWCNSSQASTIFNIFPQALPLVSGQRWNHIKRWGKITGDPTHDMDGTAVSTFNKHLGTTLSRTILNRRHVYGSDEARSDELECIFKKFGLTCPNHPCPIKQWCNSSQASTIFNIFPPALPLVSGQRWNHIKRWGKIAGDPTHDMDGTAVSNFNKHLCTTLSRTILNRRHVYGSDEARSDELECIFKNFGLTCPNHPCPIKQWCNSSQASTIFNIFPQALPLVSGQRWNHIKRWGKITGDPTHDMDGTAVSTFNKHLGTTLSRTILNRRHVYGSDEARSDELECIFKKFGLTCPNHPCPSKQWCNSSQASISFNIFLQALPLVSGQRWNHIKRWGKITGDPTHDMDGTAVREYFSGVCSEFCYVVLLAA